MLVYIKVLVKPVHYSQYGLALAYLHVYYAIHISINLGKFNKRVCLKLTFQGLNVYILHAAAYKAAAVYLQNIVYFVPVNKVLVAGDVYLHILANHLALF